MERKSLKKIFEILFLVVIIPVGFLLLLEGIIRISGINTQVVKSKDFKVGVPLWAYDDANVSIAGNIYNQILENELPVSAAEWMSCFTEADDIHYKMKANLNEYVVNTVNKIELSKGLKIHLRSNKEGFRMEDIPPKKPLQTIRIACIGDSTTFGWSVNQNERFSDRIEAQLNQISGEMRYQVLNFGIPGFTSYHGVKLLEKHVLKYSPDLVIITYGANDGRETPTRIKTMLKDSSKAHSIKKILIKFKLYQVLRKWMLKVYDPAEKLRQEQKTSQMEAFVTRAEYRENLEYMIRRCKEINCQVILLGLCCPGDYLAIMSDVGRRQQVIMLDGMHYLLKEIAAIANQEKFTKWGQEVRQLYGNQLLEEKRLLFISNDTCHPNKIGHRIIADVLLNCMQKKKLIALPKQCNEPLN